MTKIESVIVLIFMVLLTFAGAIIMKVVGYDSLCGFFAMMSGFFSMAVVHKLVQKP